MLPRRLLYLKLILLFLGGCASELVEAHNTTDESTAKPQRRFAQAQAMLSSPGYYSANSGIGGIPEICLAYMQPPTPSPPMYYQPPPTPPPAPLPPQPQAMIICLDTRYFGFLDPTFGSTISQLYDHPPPGLPPIMLQPVQGSAGAFPYSPFPSMGSAMVTNQQMGMPDFLSLPSSGSVRFSNDADESPDRKNLNIAFGQGGGVFGSLGGQYTQTKFGATSNGMWPGFDASSLQVEAPSSFPGAFGNLAKSGLPYGNPLNSGSVFGLTGQGGGTPFGPQFGASTQQSFQTPNYYLPMGAQGNANSAQQLNYGSFGQAGRGLLPPDFAGMMPQNPNYIGGRRSQSPALPTHKPPMYDLTGIDNNGIGVQPAAAREADKGELRRPMGRAAHMEPQPTVPRFVGPSLPIPPISSRMDTTDIN